MTSSDPTSNHHCWHCLAYDSLTTLSLIVVAASQVSIRPLASYQGPYSFAGLEERLAELKASQRSLSHFRPKQSPKRWEGGEVYQCHELRRNHPLQDEVHMSQRASGSGHQSSSETGDRKDAPNVNQDRTLPPINTNFQPEARYDQATVPAQSRGATAAVSQAPSMRGIESDQRTPRSIEMQNLLNPTGTRSSSHDEGRYGTALQRTSSPAISVSTPQLRAASSASSSTERSLPGFTLPPGPNYQPNLAQVPRRILTPRSPSGRFASLGTTSLPSATIDARTSPFGVARDIDILAGVPQGPYSGTSYALPRFSTQTPPDRRPSLGAAQPPASAKSDSPTTSTSSYSQFGRPSPALRATLPTTQPASSYYGSSYAPPAIPSTLPHLSTGPESSYGSLTGPAGQGPYQLMTLDTEQGPIQVPVDTQAASKVADEKRKRNAKASSRFRQRRKEKEKENSQNISKLEDQVRELAEESDFYRTERDYFRGLVTSLPGQGQPGPRPPSPRRRRIPSTTSISGPPMGAQWQSPEDQRERGRNTRRRTDSYPPAHIHILPPPTAINPPHHPRFGSPTSHPSYGVPDVRVPDNRVPGNTTSAPRAYLPGSGQYGPSAFQGPPRQ